MSNKTLLILLFAAAMIVAGVVSYWASEHPDGLDRSIEEHLAAEEEAGGEEAGEVEESAAGSPLADYKTAGVSNEFLSNALAGIIGSLLVLGVMIVIGRVLSGKRRGAARRDGAA